MHVVALATLIGWVAVSGDWHHALLVAISVLIITCPCALGLAVPIVQVTPPPSSRPMPPWRRQPRPA